MVGKMSYCKQCYGLTVGLPKGSVCNQCVLEQENGMKPKPLIMVKLVPEEKMKNGDIRKLPKANSPLWVTQWAVQGTAAKPYVVTYSTKPNTANVWSCSCPDWTKHTPRTNCKHILNVIVKEKMAIPENRALDPETAKEFAAFQKEKARKSAHVKEDWGISEGRKFR